MLLLCLVYSINILKIFWFSTKFNNIKICSETKVSLLFCFSRLLVMCRISLVGMFTYKSVISSAISVLV